MMMDIDFFVLVSCFGVFWHTKSLLTTTTTTILSIQEEVMDEMKVNKNPASY